MLDPAALLEDDDGGVVRLKKSQNCNHDQRATPTLCRCYAVGWMVMCPCTCTMWIRVSYYWMARLVLSGRLLLRIAVFAQRCSSVTLDANEFMPGRRLIAPALHLSPELSATFADKCDPHSKDASAFDRTHVTAHGKIRAHAIDVLRELDKLYLGGALHQAEALLQSLVTTSAARSM